jgi:nicotinamidase-related amidase
MKRTAVIIMSMGDDWSSISNKKLSTNLNNLVNMARLRCFPIFWVKTEHEVAYSASTLITNSTSSVSKVATIAKGDQVVTREFPSAFKGTNLCTLLRKQKVSDIVITGTVTGSCIFDTCSRAHELGFHIILAEDCICALPSEAYMEAVELTKEFAEVKNNEQVLREWSTFGEGDSMILYDIVPGSIASLDFESIKNEITWSQMYQRGSPVPRLIAIQCTQADGGRPLYRHPADEQPVEQNWTPTVENIRGYLSDKLNQEFNHALIQYYRDGEDNIGEHSDKTLDIKIGTVIVNFSIGATRTMTLRRKGEHSRVQQVPMHDNSVFCLGWETNKRWMHAIRPDKRPDHIKSASEVLNGGQRISFTFRTIATFIDGSGIISGQGAKAAGTIAEYKDDSMEMLAAFSKENHEDNFDWFANYGMGFQSLNFKVLNTRSKGPPS